MSVPHESEDEFQSYRIPVRSPETPSPYVSPIVEFSTRKTKRGAAPKRNITKFTADKYSYRGRLLSVAAIAKIVGVSKKRVAKQLQQGKPVEEILHTPREKRGRSMLPVKRHPYQGGEITISELACLTGVDTGQLYSWIKTKTVDEIIDFAARRKPDASHKHYILAGVRCTIQDIATASKRSRATIRQQLRYGRTPDQIVAESKENKKSLSPAPEHTPLPRRLDTRYAENRGVTVYPYKDEFLSVSQIAERIGDSCHNVRIMLKSKTAEEIISLRR